MGVLWRLAKNELAKMGRFILAIAVERVLAEGVKVEAVIRSGVLRDVLLQVVREMELTTIFLEHPVGETCRLNEAELERFLASFQAGRSE